MLSRVFMNISFVAMVAAMAVILAVGSAAAGDLTKADVEKVVHDYIMHNPQVILDAVDGYQKKSMAERQAGALEKHKQTLMNNLDSPIGGNADGDVTVVEFFDYNCGYCKKAFFSIQEAIEKDKKVRVIFKEFPILGPSSETAAKWALAADKQKKYFVFHKKLMDNKSPINDALLEKIAKSVGLDIDQMKKDVAGPDVQKQIEENRDLAVNLGISGTPAFVIGDEVVPGVIFQEDLIKKIAAQRSKQAKN